MQVMLVRDTPFPTDSVTSRSVTFRYSLGRAVACTVALVAAFGVLEAFVWRSSPAIATYIGIVSSGAAVVYRKLLTARFTSSNWLLCTTANGLYIKLRSYLNENGEPWDAPVAWLPFTEIRFIQFVHQLLHVASLTGGAARSIRSRWLLEVVVSSDTTTLQAALRHETILRGAGSAGTRSHFAHEPVQLAAPDQVDIEWAVVPRRAAFLNAVKDRVQIKPTIEERDDYAALRQQSRAEQETRLLDLVSMGRTLAAVRLARILYGYDVTEAATFIRQLEENGKT